MKSSADSETARMAASEYVPALCLLNTTTASSATVVLSSVAALLAAYGERLTLNYE